MNGTLRILMIDGQLSDVALVRASLDAWQVPVSFTALKKLEEAESFLDTELPHLMLVASQLIPADNSGILATFLQEPLCPLVVMGAEHERGEVESLLGERMSNFLVKTSEGLASMAKTLEQSLPSWHGNAGSEPSPSTTQLSDAQFGSIFASASAGMAIVGADGTILQPNPAFCELLGYSATELSQLTLKDITHPWDRSKTERLYGELLAGRHKSLDYEKRYVRKDGSIVWGHPTVALSTNREQTFLHFVAQVQDISDRREAEKELLAAHQKLQSIIEFLPDATFVIDRENNVTAWNREMEEKTGVRKEQILGQGDYAYAEALYGERKPTLIDMVGEYDLGTAAQYSFFEQKGEILFAERFMPTLYDGKGAYVWLKASPLYDPEGNLIGAIESIRDITRRKQAEEQLKEANHELDAFVHTVSHDLRAPLTPIIGYAEHLRSSCRDRLDEDVLSCLQEIEKQGRRMSTLLEELLAFAQVGHIDEPNVAVELEEVLHEAMLGLGSLALEKGMQIEAEKLPELCVPRTLLFQLLNNLIGNALQYAGSKPGTIEVGGERLGKSVRFYVQDHGPGIDAAERDKIFELFVRGQRQRESKGTGVGLAIVQKIAHRYGGRAWVEETPGGGATFWVEMSDV